MKLLLKFAFISILLLAGTYAIDGEAHFWFGGYNPEESSLEIWLENDSTVAGVQIYLSGPAISSVSGGISEELGWMMFVTDSLILGFGFDEPLPPYIQSGGNQLFTIVQFPNPIETPVCFSNIAVTGPIGAGFNVTSSPCFTPGCMDDLACNYNPDVTWEDGSCVMPEGCNNWCSGDEGAPLAEDCAGDCGGTAIVNDCGCVNGSTGYDENYCFGCLDPEAWNYDPDATIDDESCEYYIMGDLNADGIVNVLDVVVMVDIILGYEATEYQLIVGDLFEPPDGILSVLDIVLLIDLILNG